MADRLRVARLLSGECGAESYFKDNLFENNSNKSKLYS
jgi:hypothetical protein